MASKFNPGRTIGRVSIRVLPDTRSFNRELRKQLNDTVRNVKAKVKVNIDVDPEALRKSLDERLGSLQDMNFDLTPKIDVAAANKRARQLRDNIRRELSGFENFRANYRMLVKDPKQFEHDVRELVRKAERNKVNIPVAVSTAVARARLAYAARTRVVTFLVNVSKSSVAKAATTLAALSGTRLAGKWLDDLREFATDLDKNLPRILGWTSGITTGIGGLIAAVGGLSGLGQGLVSMLPALLVLPGLALNAVGSITALFVAWKNAGKELKPAADEMRELADIINTTYWDRARKPILDLVTGLMPQLRNSFRDLSEGVGDFTAALAQAFGKELAGGRMESIFKGIANGWRVLGTGASGFAGALVSLSNIAATYTPRLAGWFVRQANTFDAWLDSISNDGRLSHWMEGAIDSMYDFWHATTGAAGVLKGIWKAADAAGSEGLDGFARLMQAWNRSVNSASFQKGLTAIFRGSYTAMEAFGRGISAVGKLVGDLDYAFEGFIGAAGTFVGGLVESVATALNNAHVDVGLQGLSEGLQAVLNGIRPSLQPIADTFGQFLGLVGDLAGNIIPVAVSAISSLMPGVQTLMGVVGKVTPGLSAAAQSVIDNLAPAVNDLVAALAPSVTSILGTLGTALSDIAPKMADLASAFSPALVAAMDGLAAAVKPLADLASQLWGIATIFKGAVKGGDLSWLWDNKSLDGVVKGLKGKDGWIGQLFTWADSVDKEYDKQAKRNANTYVDSLDSRFRQDLPGRVTDWTTQLRGEFDKSQLAGNDLWKNFLSDGNIPDDVKSKVKSNLQALGVDLSAMGGVGGGGFSRGLAQGITGGLPDVSAAVGQVKPTVTNPFADAGTWLLGIGQSTIGGFQSGAQAGKGPLGGLFGGIGGFVRGFFGGAGTWLSGSGSQAMGGLTAGAELGRPGLRGTFSGARSDITAPFGNPWGILAGAGSAIMSGLLSGLRSAWVGVKAFVRSIAPWIADNKGPESYDRRLLVDNGQWIMGGLQKGLERGFGNVKSRVSDMAGEIRDQFSDGVGGQIDVGLTASADAARLAASAAVKAKDTGSTSDTPSRRGGVQVTFINPVSRDPQQDAWEAAQIVGSTDV